MTLQEMIEKRAKALASARALTDQITDDTTDERAAELNTQHDAAMEEFDKFDEMITRHRRLQAADAQIEADARNAHDAEAARNRPQGTQGGEDRTGGDGDGPTYADAFFDFLRHGADPSRIQDEMRGILMAGRQDFANEQRLQLTAPDTAGGFTVPTLLQDGLVVAMADNGPMYDGNIVTELLTETGAQMEYPTINDLDGELDALPEGSEVVYDAGKAFIFGQKPIGAHMFDSKFIKVSRTLMQDSNQAMVTVLSGLLGERAGRTANKKLTTGTGVNEPEGIAVGSSLGHTSTAAGAITSDDLLDMEHSVNGVYRRRPTTRWQMNDTTLKTVRKFKDANGNYIWQARNIQTGTPETLLGYGISINPDLADVAAGTSPVIFGDMKKYIVRKVGNIVIGTAREKFWPNLGLAAIVRFDGRVIDARAIKRMEIRA